MASRELLPAATPTRRLTLEIAGAGRCEEWSAAEVVRDLKDFSGSFTFILRDATRSLATFEWASPPPVFRLRPGPEVRILIDGELVLHGYIEKVIPDIDDERAEVTISGRDKAGDLIDCAAAPDGPGEFRQVKLEEAARRVAAPFGLKVRSEIDTGHPFPRYPLDLAETGLAAIEKGARQRHALVTSDGTGGVVITRTGASRAPAALTLPGNMKASRAEYSHENRHSDTIVRGQAERAGGRREGRAVPLDVNGDPHAVDERQAGDGSATERERYGTAIVGRAQDPEITRYRPIVHLAKTQPDEVSATDEADWRMRTARAEAEDLQTRVHDFRANGALWKVNQLAFVSDRYQGIERDLLISRTVYRYDEKGAETELTLSSPEAFDARPIGGRRTNKRSGGKASRSGGGLDGTAEAL
ncbi:phage baseplate assembly protein [Afifella pfennigii]|uniref:phage baseplate assembly protein n=1 Tax=Afifella pfennigii TaxID=209897 RepID=UPI0009FE6E18|nr:Mu P family protein [Afifella pfennigii]